MEYVDQMAPSVAALPLSLVLISVAAGVVMMLLFKVASNPAAIKRAKRRVQAQLLALRLFGDEPALVWKAQTRLLTGNVRYIGVMLAPILAAAIPFMLAYPHLEALYGRSALPVGSDTVLTIRLRGPVLQPASLEVPVGLKAETPAVRIADAHEVSWRLRASAPVAQPVTIHVGGTAISKLVEVGETRGYLSETRPSSAWAWLFDPGEAPISDSSVDSVHVVYRSQRLAALGLEWPWEGWFIAISVVVALLAKNRLGVVF